MTVGEGGRRLEDVREGEDLTPGGSLDFLLLFLVLHLLARSPAVGELAVEKGEDPRGSSQWLDVGCRGAGWVLRCWSWAGGEFAMRGRGEGEAPQLRDQALEIRPCT